MKLKKKHKCNICAFSTKYSYYLSEHINSIHFQQKFSCNLCDFQAASNGNLSKHVKNIHRREDIVCIQCNKTIKLASVAHHKRKFHSGEQIQHKCDLCPFQTIHKEYLNKHKVSIHKR